MYWNQKKTHLRTTNLVSEFCYILEESASIIGHDLFI